MLYLKEYVFCYCRNYRIQVELPSVVPQLTLLLPHHLRFVSVWNFHEWLGVLWCAMCVCYTRAHTWHGVISSALCIFLPMKAKWSLLKRYIFIIYVYFFICINLSFSIYFIYVNLKCQPQANYMISWKMRVSGVVK